MSAVTMPTTRPSRSSSGPPELPGLTAASTWMRPVCTLLGLGVAERALEPGHDAGAQRAVEPERVADDVRLAADLQGGRVAEHGRHDDGGQRVGLEDGDVVLLVLRW